MAAIAGAPLVHVFNLRERGGHYRFTGFPPQRPQMPPHNQRDAYLRDCAARFACDLESIVKRDPLQWYNFYPFWSNIGERSKLQTSTRMDTDGHDNAALGTPVTARRSP